MLPDRETRKANGSCSYLDCTDDVLEAIRHSTKSRLAVVQGRDLRGTRTPDPTQVDAGIVPASVYTLATQI